MDSEFETEPNILTSVTPINEEKYIGKEVGIATSMGAFKGICTELDLINGYIELDEESIWNLKQVANIRIIKPGTKLIVPGGGISTPRA